MSTTNEPALLLGERLLRSDKALVGMATYQGFWPATQRRSSSGIMHLSVMIVTNGRLIFEPPSVPLHHRMIRFLWWFPPFSYLVLLWGMPPLSKRLSFDLNRIARFHTW